MGRSGIRQRVRTRAVPAVCQIKEIIQKDPELPRKGFERFKGPDSNVSIVSVFRKASICPSLPSPTPQTSRIRTRVTNTVGQRIRNKQLTERFSDGSPPQLLPTSPLPPLQHKHKLTHIHMMISPDNRLTRSLDGHAHVISRQRTTPERYQIAVLGKFTFNMNYFSS